MNKRLNYWLALSVSLVMATSPIIFSSCSDGAPKKDQKEANKDGNGENGESNGSNPGEGQSVTGKVGKYPYVDLGLPSGLKWATYNIGATKIEESGNYFAWGETTPQPKSDYCWTTYKWRSGNPRSVTKYCTDRFYGTVDDLTTLLPEDDAATANWGSAWRMPTMEEQEELREACDWKWTNNFNGTRKSGMIGTSKTNGNTIFLPAAGCYDCGRHNNTVGYYGSYWSSSLSEFSNSASVLDFDSDHIGEFSYPRPDGQPVRAVSEE